MEWKCECGNVIADDDDWYSETGDGKVVSYCANCDSELITVE